MNSMRETLEYVRTSYRMDVMRLRELGRQTAQADEAIQRIDAALSATPQGSLPNLADANQKDPSLSEAREEIERLKERNAILEALTATPLFSHRALTAKLYEIIATRFGTRFMDPPDGGDVPAPDQVERMADALVTAEAERAALKVGLRECHTFLAQTPWLPDDIEEQKRRWAMADRILSVLENSKARLADANTIQSLTLSRDEALEALRVERKRVGVLEEALGICADVLDRLSEENAADVSPQTWKEHGCEYARIKSRSVLAQGDRG